MDLDEFFRLGEPYSVQTWQFNGPDRVTAPDQAAAWIDGNASIAREGALFDVIGRRRG